MSRRGRCPTRLAVVAKATATHLRQVQRVWLNVRERREGLKRRGLRRGERDAEVREHGPLSEKAAFLGKVCLSSGGNVALTPGRKSQMWLQLAQKPATRVLEHFFRTPSLRKLRLTGLSCKSAAQSASGWPATLMVSSASTLMTGGAALLPNPPSRTVSMVDSASRPQYYCYGRSQINGLSASPQRASKTSGKRVLREPLSELPGSGPLQGKLKPPARVSLSPTKLETVMAALEIEPIESPPHVALACVQQAVEPKETRELSLERRYASWFEMAPALDGDSALNSPPGFHEAPS